MPTLFSWYPKAYGSEFLFHGVVSGHPRLPEGEHIHTSAVRRIIQVEDGIQLETRSGSEYQLAMSELDAFAGTPLPPPESLGLPPDFWSCCCCQARIRIKAEKAAAMRSPSAPGTLWLRIVGSSALSALWTGPQGELHCIPIAIHTGMFQDSVLVRGHIEYLSDGSKFDIDFRYFPHHCLIEPYVISSVIKALLIVNDGLQDVTFRYAGQFTPCTAGKTTQITVAQNSDQPDFE